MFERLPSTPVELKNVILSECIESLRFKTLTDNFDKKRFNHDGIDRSDLFNVKERVFWISWFCDTYVDLFETMSLFESERSKRLFLNIIAYRLAGHHSIRIETGFGQDDHAYDAFIERLGGTPSTLATTGIFGSLTHYEFVHEGKRYVLDCSGLRTCLWRRQYFFSEDGIDIQPGKGDFVVDAGACLGDTSVVFGKAVGPEGKVFAFDPVENHLEVLEHNIRQNPDCDIQAIPFGLSDKDVICPPIRLNGYSPGFNSCNKIVPIRALDSLALEGVIQKVDFLKMDIEGAELSALRGAAGCIRKYRPRLAISLYHKPNDIFDIPKYLNQEFPFYEMHIGHYTIHNEETVLYCRPRSE